MDNNKIFDALTSKTVAVFLTHCQGFNALSDELLDAVKERGLWLIEDVCESTEPPSKGKS